DPADRCHRHRHHLAAEIPRRLLGLGALRRSARTAGRLTTCRCAQCMADMLTFLLLTNRSKSICVPVAGDAAPYPPPSDPRLGDTNLSCILLPRLGVHWFSAYPPPLRWALLQMWLRPYHWAPTSVGASFFARSP